MSPSTELLLTLQDFETSKASKLLARYRSHHLVFNDDIQGTASTALAGLYGALAVLGLPAKALCDQRIVIAGCGSAGE